MKRTLVAFILIMIVCIAVIISIRAGLISIGDLSRAPSPQFSSEQVAQIEKSCDEITKKFQGPASSSKTRLLAQAQKAALAQPNIEWAKIDHNQLVVKFKEGGEAIWLLNTLKYDFLEDLPSVGAISDGVAYRKNTVVSSAIIPLLDIHRSEMETILNKFNLSIKSLKEIVSSTMKASGVDPSAPEESTNTSSNNAVLINALAEETNPNIKEMSHLLDTNIKGLLESCNYNVLELNGPDASPERLKTLSDMSVIIMLGHGSPTKFQTGKRWTPSDYNRDWLDRKIIPMFVAWGNTGVSWWKYKSEKVQFWQHRAFCAVTGEFWKDAYANSPFKDALFINLACYGATDKTYRDALFKVGVKAYTGWTDEQGKAPSSAYLMLAHMTNGKTLGEAIETLKNEWKNSSEVYDGETHIAKLLYDPESEHTWKLSCSNNMTRGVRLIDFFNYTYPPSPCMQNNGYNHEITVKNGEFSTEEAVYSISDPIIYCDINRDGNEDALIWAVCGLNYATYVYNEIMVYSVIDEQPTMLAKLTDDDIERDYKKYYNSPNDIFWNYAFERIFVNDDNNIVFERATEGPRACPENMTSFEYDGTAIL